MQTSPHVRVRLPADLRRDNNFDALRLLAALAVLVSHAYALAGAPQPQIGAQNLGQVGVWVFFGISGFLVAQSWTLEPHLGRFLRKRALRILPALLVVLLVTVLVLGLAFTALAPGAYLGDPATWDYLVRNAVLQTTAELPGVFTDNPYPRQVNGSLWTLAPEAWAYLAVAGLGLLGALKTRWAAPAVALVLLAIPHDPTGTLPWSKEIWLLQAFAVGASLLVLRDRVPWRWDLAAVLVAGFAFLPSEALQLKFAVFAIPYATILVAYAGPRALRRLASRGDFSYGIYLYAWPVGQAVAALWPGVSPLGMIALSLPVTFALGAASWFVVERPALALKNGLRRRGRDPRAPAAAPVYSRR